MLAVGIILYVVFTTEIHGTIYKTNLTDFSRCKVHYSRSETTYNTFYEISNDDRENDMLLDFHFSVQASRDAHILFAPTSVLNRQDPVYEIVLGAGLNSFAEIRRAQKTAGKASVRIGGLVSSVDVHSFWFHISSDGLLEIGRETEELAFLVWKDPDPIPVRVFSLSSWRGVEAKWYFDCARNNLTNTNEVEPVLTDLQRLHKVLFTDYHPFVRPVLVETDRTLVTMGLVPLYVSLDEHRGILDIKGDGTLNWWDEKLIWNPDDFGGIDKLVIPSYKIWNPDVVLYSSVNTNYDIFGSSSVIVSFFGSVQRSSYFHLQSWCDAGSLGTWPSDNHTCNLEFGFWRDIFNVQLQFSSNQSEHLKHQSASEWKIYKLDVTVNYGWQNNTYADPPGLFLRFTLVRQSNIYKLIYFTPFIVIAILMLATFWVSPFEHLKITLGCIQLVLSCAILIHLGLIIPGHPNHVPNLLLLYSSSLIATVISIGISILVINISRTEHKYNLPYILCKILTSSIVQSGLFLPVVKEDPNEYGKFDSTLIPANYDSVQVMWILFGTAIDRISFIVYFFLVIFAISVKY